MNIGKKAISKPLLYFVYGGDMNVEQIGGRCRGAKALAVARLPDHRLAFYGHSERWDGGEETVVAQPGDEVYGVVYQLSSADSDRLDLWQGIKLDGTGPYFHTPAEVVGLDGKTYSVLMYERAERGFRRDPSTEYLDHIIIGAIWHQLPVAYIERLRGMASERAGYRVPREDNTAAFLGEGGGGCSC